MMRTTRGGKTAGTSMIEILVVIVVFLVGILAIVQIFPGGFRLLTQSRAQTIAQNLAGQMLTRAVSQTDGVPEAILPVEYRPNGANLDVIPAANRRPGDLSPFGDAIDSTGVVYYLGTAIGYWPYVSGPNIMRRVVGESHRIPAPRSIGTDFGGFLTLTYAPVLVSQPAHSTVQYNQAFEIYGPDLIGSQGAPTVGTTYPDYEFFIQDSDTSTPTLQMPRATGDAAGADNRTYRYTLTAWVIKAGVTSRREVTGTMMINSAPGGGFLPVSVATLPNVVLGGETLASVEPESIRIAQLFTPIMSGNFSYDPSDATKKPIRAYEYKIVGSPELGQVLFSPAGYNQFQSRPEGRVPLTARATYDVYDWRIIHDDFRIPAATPLQYKLTLSSLRVLGRNQADGTPYTGLGLQLPRFGGAPVVYDYEHDFALIDTETGGVYLPESYRIDSSAGILTFIDQDSNLSNGLQMKLVYPGSTVVSTIDAAGRSVRALYMANNDWSVQVMKASSLYTQNAPIDSMPQAMQYYVGGSSGSLGGSATRVYFPWADLGQKVKIEEVVYTDGTSIKTLKDQDFLVSKVAADPFGLPSVDIKDFDSSAVSFDSSTYGYAVKGVKGVSISARTLWNISVFSFGSNPTTNLSLLSKYQSNYRHANLDTVVQRGDNP